MSSSTSSRSSRRCRSAIGASAAGARAYTATASQGLLYMAEAVYNASGLGLPIVMTLANRAIGAPINIWNDHSDAMAPARLRLDPAVRREQPGGDRPSRAGVPAGRGAVAAGHGLHGRIRPDPRLRGDRRAEAGAGRRVPPAVRAASGARSGRAGDDRRDGRAGRVHGGPIPRPPPQLDALEAIPRLAAELRGDLRPRLRAGS